MIQNCMIQLSHCNARSQCRLRVVQISVDHVIPAREQQLGIFEFGKLRIPYQVNSEIRPVVFFALYAKTITHNFSLTHGIMLGNGMKIPILSSELSFVLHGKTTIQNFSKSTKAFNLKTWSRFSSFIQSVHKDFNKCVKDKTCRV